MERKRELTSVDLRAVAAELRAYEGAKVDKAYLYDDDLLRLRMRDFDRGRVELLVEVGETKRAHVSDPDRVPDAPGRPPNFAMQLRNRISGADFAGVEQYGFDRVLTFRFERPDGDTLVVAELFGDGNVAVLNGDRETLACLETVRLKSRTVAPGAVYEYPEARFDPLGGMDYEGFAARMDDSDADIVRTLATRLNFGGSWAEELCSRAEVPYNMDIAEAGEAQYRPLYRVVEELRGTLAAGEFDARVYYAEEGGDGDGGEPRRLPVDVTPVPLVEREGEDAEPFETFQRALDTYFHEFEESETEEGGAGQRPDFESEIAKYERIIDQQEGAIEGFDEQAEAERRRAELLYARYDTVDEVIRAVRSARDNDVPWEDIGERFAQGAEQGIPEAEAVVDVDGREGTVTLELDDTRVEVDPSVGVERNADLLYQEAKRVQEKKEGALEAIEDTREQLAEVKRRREQWEADDGDDDHEPADEDSEEPVDWLSRESIPIRRDEQWYEQFRWFHTSDGFLVIGGRDADDNEAIVKKYMEKGDRFFHAQASGAPATVLKATGPSEPSREVEFPESTLEQAAQFAVSYSSVWKAGQFAGDAYMVRPDQVTKTPEPGEYIEKGSFVIRGERTYFEDTPVGAAVGVAVEPQTRVVGGPPAAIAEGAATAVRLEPGQYAQNDIAKMIYRELRERFVDETFVRKVASPDRVQEFCPAGGSRIVED
jgi:predicted ribosome quality control (RQC) complex YloA/Tae2 family protein